MEDAQQERSTMECTFPSTPSDEPQDNSPGSSANEAQVHDFPTNVAATSPSSNKSPPQKAESAKPLDLPDNRIALVLKTNSSEAQEAEFSRTPSDPNSQDNAKPVYRQPYVEILQSEPSGLVKDASTYETDLAIQPENVHTTPRNSLDGRNGTSVPQNEEPKHETSAQANSSLRDIAGAKELSENTSQGSLPWNDDSNLSKPADSHSHAELKGEEQPPTAELAMVKFKHKIAESPIPDRPTPESLKFVDESESESDDPYDTENFSEASWSDEIDPSDSASGSGFVFTSFASRPHEPSQRRNSDSDSIPSICRPLPDGTFRNPFTSSKEDTMAMFEASIAAKNTGKPSPWMYWAKKHSMGSNRLRRNAHDSTFNHQVRHEAAGQSTFPEPARTVPATYSQTPSMGQYNDQIPGYYNGQWQQNYMQYGLDEVLPDPLQPAHVRVDNPSDSKIIVTVPIQPSPHINKDLSVRPLSHLWIQSNALMENGTRTELVKISSIEHYYDAFGNSMTAVTKLGGSNDIPNVAPTGSMSPGIKWLNIQTETLSLGFLRDLVVDCPYRNEALSLALKLLGDQEAQASKPSNENDSSEFGTAIRYDGCRRGKETITSVTFIAHPYLTVKEKRMSLMKQKGNEYLAKTLVQTLYRYEPEDQLADISESTIYEAPFGKKRVAFVPQLWCLLIEPDIMITMSQLPLAELAGRNIEIEDDSLDSQKRTRTVSFHYDNGVEQRREIKCDCTYFELVYLVAQINGRDSSIDAAEAASRLEDSTGTLLTTERWKELLNTREDQEIELRIRPNPLRMDSIPPSPTSTSSPRRADQPTSQARHPTSIRNRWTEMGSSASSKIDVELASAFQNIHNNPFNIKSTGPNDISASYGARRVMSPRWDGQYNPST
ncbi:hypothetical protein F4677DRAFT_81083 [Hypoxylon crocopeplum]|nr:hypothetical protein F4677DRAFT_81083 [Hypoxylon crocopeplum]